MAQYTPTVITVPSAADRSPDGAAPQEGMSMPQMLAILRAHRWKSVLVALLVIIAAAVATKLMPKTYTSVATLMVNPQGTDPLANREVPMSLLGSFYATELELIQGPDVLDEVIERLDLTRVPEFASGNRGGEATLRDWVETRLRRNLDIEPGHGGSQLIYVTAWASDAKRAADIANTILDVYMEQRVARTSVPANQRAQRYAHELADLKHKMDSAQAGLTDFRTRTGAADLDAKVDVDLELLNSLEHKLLDARTALNSNQARASGQQDVSQNVLASTSQVSALRAEEAKLNARMAQMRATLGPRHPQVAQLQSEIDANQASLRAALATYTTAAHSDVSVLDTEVRTLERQVEAQRQKVMDKHRYRDLASNYQVQLESAQQVYRKALDGYDEAKFASTADNSTITVAARARPSVKADRPNAIKNMALGTGAGIALALLLPFLLELPNRRIRCRDDIERDTGVPVLVVFPRVAQRRSASGARA